MAYWKERPQESHAWHAQTLGGGNLSSLDQSRSITIVGNEKSGVLQGGVPFHVPILGGWKNYVLLETNHVTSPWHIGWVLRKQKTTAILRFELHKLPLSHPRVRMLSGTEGYETTFFAVDTDGNQIRLKLVDVGRIGDHKYPSIRLL